MTYIGGMERSFYEDAAFLRLAAGAAQTPRLDAPHASAERRSPVCGSRIIVDVTVDDAGRVSAVGMRVNACLVGQTAAHLMATGAAGRTGEEIDATRVALVDWLSGTTETAPDWPGIDALAPVRPKTGRHAAVLIAFEAAAAAARDAAEAEPAR